MEGMTFTALIVVLAITLGVCLAQVVCNLTGYVDLTGVS